MSARQLVQGALGVAAVVAVLAALWALSGVPL